MWGFSDMKYVIENNTLKETIWESDHESQVVVIPDGIETLASWCLDSYDNPFPAPDLLEVVIPGSVTCIEYDAFSPSHEPYRFPNLLTVRFHGTLDEWCRISKGWDDFHDGYGPFGPENYSLYLLDNTGNEYLAENLVFSKEYNDIPACCFTGCGSLKTVEILGDASIGVLAFTDCHNLEKLSILGKTLRIDFHDEFGQMVFDDRESLEVILSDAAADSALVSEDLPPESYLYDMSTRLMLEDREETLDEILSLVETLRDEYTYRYHLPEDLPPIQFYREYLRIKHYEESSADQEAFDDINGELDEDAASETLQDGFHYDEGTNFSLTVRTLYQKMHSTMTVCLNNVKELSLETDKGIIPDSTTVLALYHTFVQLLENLDTRLEDLDVSDGEDSFLSYNAEEILELFDQFRDRLEYISETAEEQYDLSVDCQDDDNNSDDQASICADFCESVRSQLTDIEDAIGILDRIHELL